MAEKDKMAAESLPKKTEAVALLVNMFNQIRDRK